MVRRRANDGRLYTHIVDLKLIKRSPYDNDVSARNCMCMGPKKINCMFPVTDFLEIG